MNLNALIKWVASYPKSGNTWARLFLLAYMMPEEMEFQLNKRPLSFVQDCEMFLWENLLPRDRDGNAIPIEKIDTGELLLCRLGACMNIIWQARYVHGQPPFVKTHAANLIVSDVGEVVIPQPCTDRALYLIRDPRDIAVSFADHMGLPVDQILDNMANGTYGIMKPGIVPVMLSSWSGNVRSWTRDLPYPVQVLRYEDLLTDPATNYRLVLNFFGLPYKASRFERALAVTSFDNLRQLEDEAMDEEGNWVGYAAKSNHQERFFRQGKSGRYAEVLTVEQIRRIEADHGEVMKRYGYEPHDGPAQAGKPEPQEEPHGKPDPV